MTGKVNIRKLEADLWESADLLRAGSKLTSSQCCMPELALLFLRYAYSRYRMVETELLRNRSSRGGRVIYCKWGYGGTCLPKLMSGDIRI